MPQPPSPDARHDVVVPLARRRTERRDACGDGLYSREVLELLRACGAPLPAGDAGASGAAIERRSVAAGGAPT